MSHATAQLSLIHATTVKTPFIVLYPTTSNKKAVTVLNEKRPWDTSGHNSYAAYTEGGDDIDQNYIKMLDITLLHECIPRDGVIQTLFGSIVDDPNSNPVYGPFNVYGILAKDQTRVNADRYAHYTSQVLWMSLCGHELQAPRFGTDDEDPDCGRAC